MNENILKKLQILADAAKYDASCASSGANRKNTQGGVGSALATGVCHSFSDDGRCISLLKVLYSNVCVYDCAYCVNRRSNDVPRAGFTPAELSELTIEFYRRNYVEGLFLSSAVARSPDCTMEGMVRALKDLREKHRFNGYIHMKCIPGASRELVEQAGLYADRLSVNIEIPSEPSLKQLAPEKDYQSVYTPMRHIREGMLRSREERGKYRSAPRFAPAGQSTQMIIGASGERDREILLLSSLLYKGPELRRVYYSGFIPINGNEPRLPALKSPPLVRENRLYQADWLMRKYFFAAEEILDPAQPDLDLEIDPKLAWALRHPHLFPLDVNRADYREILRVPGIGIVSAQRIIAARRLRRLSPEHLKALGVVMKRAHFFLAPQGRTRAEPAWTIQEAGPKHVRDVLTKRRPKSGPYQLSLFVSEGLCPKPPEGALPPQTPPAGA